jgi:hypothetical protein
VAKALTIKQPWAAAIFELGKDVENRKRRTNYCGPLFIHAAKEDSCEGWQWLDEHGFALPVDPPTGAIIGVVELVKCVREYDSIWAFPGYWHWVLENPETLPLVPTKGELSMFDPIARTKSRKEASVLGEVWQARRTRLLTTKPR